MLRETLLALAMATAPVATSAAPVSPEAAAESLAAGAPLSRQQLEVARRVGVRDPSRVRLRVVEELPAPTEPRLVAAAGRIGLMPQAASGMTLGYAVIVCRGAERDARLLSHELRHVAQYERLGGIRAFLAEHIGDLLEFGYEDSPFERDARAHELR